MSDKNLLTLYVVFRIQRLNENKKRVTKLETEAEFRFKKLNDALELKTNEMIQLSGEFEERMRRKEEEQIRLKKELTQIAIGELNVAYTIQVMLI